MKKRVSLLIAGLFLFITFIGMLVWDLNCPRVSDDYNYELIVHDQQTFWDCDSEPIQTMGDAWSSVINHILTDNGRLANSLSILFQPFGRWMECLFLAVCGALTIGFVVRCSKPRRAHLGAAAIIATVLYWFGLPWYDSFMSLDYQINYLPASVLVLFVAGAWGRLGTYSRARLTVFYVLSFLAGWMHEGFGAVLLVWIVAAQLFSLKYTRGWIAFCLVLAGVCVNVLSGTVLRIDAYSSHINYGELGGIMSRIILESWIFFAGLVLAAVRYLYVLKVDREKSVRVLRRYLPWLLASAGGMAMAMILVMADRALWPTQLFAMVVVTDIFARVFGRLGAKLWLVLGLMATVFYIIFLMQLCRWTRIIRHENEAVELALGERVKRQDNVYFADLTPSDAVPTYLRNVVYQPLHSYFDLLGIYGYYARKRTYMVVLPKDLESKPFEEWPLIPGTAGMRGEWPIILTADSTCRDVWTVLGPYDNRMPYVDRFLSGVSNGFSNDTIAARIPSWFSEVHTKDGRTLYWHAMPKYPRTLRYREVLRIDRAD